jgi:hypothetical protein
MIENPQQTILNKTKQDKFILIINTPPALKSIQTNSERTNNLMNLDKMQYSVWGVNVPPHSISEIETPFMGQTMHVTSQTRQKYPPIKVNFNIDSNFDNYFYIWKWLTILNDPRNSGMDEHFAEFTTLNEVSIDNMRKNINNESTKYKHIKMKNNYDDYQTIMSLYGLREYNEKIIKWDFYNSFPTILEGFDYNYQNSEDITCSFNFAYGQVDISLVDPI